MNRIIFFRKLGKHLSFDLGFQETRLHVISYQNSCAPFRHAGWGSPKRVLCSGGQRYMPGAGASSFDSQRLQGIFRGLHLFEPSVSSLIVAQPTIERLNMYSAFASCDLDCSPPSIGSHRSFVLPLPCCATSTACHDDRAASDDRLEPPQKSRGVSVIT